MGLRFTLHRHARSRGIGLGTAALLFGAIALTAAPSAGAATDAAPAFCHGSTAINAMSVSSPLTLSQCPIQGRLLRIPLGDGRFVADIDVPPAGRTVGNATLTRDGEFEVIASNVKGVLSVRTLTPTTPQSGMAPAADPACSENAYNTEGAFWQSVNVEPTLLWYYNEATASRAGLTVSGTEADIRGGNTNMTTGQNNCGYATGVFPVHGAFEGNTGLYANIDSSGACTSKFPDGQNTVSFGPFDSSASGTEAVTCWTSNSSTRAMTEADIYIGSNVGMVDALPANCSSSLDLQTIVTHEWGHAYGLAHETSGPDEVMYPTKSYCQVRRHLGEGDYNGMASLYGLNAY